MPKIQKERQVVQNEVYFTGYVKNEFLAFFPANCVPNLPEKKQI